MFGLLADSNLRFLKAVESDLEGCVDGRKQERVQR